MPIAIAAVLLQSVAGPPAPVVPRPRIERPCPPAGDDGDIVVCGRADAERYRLKAPAATAPREGLPPAEMRFGGGTIGVGGEAGAVGGVATNRAVLKWRRPF